MPAWSGEGREGTVPWHSLGGTVRTVGEVLLLAGQGRAAGGVLGTSHASPLANVSWVGAPGSWYLPPARLPCDSHSRGGLIVALGLSIWG